MKKLMIAAFAVAFAAVAQAAAVAWTLDGIYGAGENGSGWGSDLISGSDYTIELIVGTTLTDGVIGGVITDWSHDFGELDSGYMENYSESESMLADVNYYAQVVITKGDSKLESLVGTIVATNMNDGVSEPYISTDAGLVLNFDGIPASSMGAFSAEGWTGAAVPEPTSALMLLVGLAGLALKRKVA